MSPWCLSVLSLGGDLVTTAKPTLGECSPRGSECDAPTSRTRECDAPVSQAPSRAAGCAGPDLSSRAPGGRAPSEESGRPVEFGRGQTQGQPGPRTHAGRNPGSTRAWRAGVLSGRARPGRAAPRVMQESGRRDHGGRRRGSVRRCRSELRADGVRGPRLTPRGGPRDDAQAAGVLWRPREVSGHRGWSHDELDTRCGSRPCHTSLPLCAEGRARRPRPPPDLAGAILTGRGCSAEEPEKGRNDAPWET